MTLTIIAAINKKRGIGYRNELLYRLPDDLKRFKSLTTGHTVIMGRKTFESLPKGALPNRRNIVLSRREGACFEGAECFRSLDEALQACAGEEEVFVIGGAVLYRESMPMADRLCITEVEDDTAPADAFFPEIDETEWHKKSRECHPADERHLYPYAFTDYERVRR